MSCPRHRYGQVVEAHEDPTHPAPTGGSVPQPAHNHGAQQPAVQQPAVQQPAVQQPAVQQPAARRSRPADKPVTTPKGNVRLR
jgi:hypothetical protein